MPEPLTMIAAGAALTEGVKFLYTQAGDLLQRRRARKEREAGAGEAVTPVETDALAGDLEPVEPDWEVLETVADDLGALRGQLAVVAEGDADADPADRATMEAAEAVRRSLEAVLRQRITLVGEDREPSGPLVRGSVDVGAVAAYAAAVRARVIRRGTVIGTGRADRVGEDGELIGVDAEEIG